MRKKKKIPLDSNLFQPSIPRGSNHHFSFPSFGNRFLKLFTVFLVILCLSASITGASYKSYKSAVHSIYQVTESVGSVVQNVASSILAFTEVNHYSGVLFLTIDGVEYQFNVNVEESGFPFRTPVYTIVNAPDNLQNFVGKKFVKAPFGRFIEKGVFGIWNSIPGHYESLEV